MNKIKGLLFVTILLGLGLFYFTGGNEYFSLGYLQEKLQSLRIAFENSPWQTAGFFSIVYLLSTALSIPGAAVLTLLSGAIFGLGPGLLLASFSSTLGSLLAFLLSRFILRDYVKSHFRKQFQKMDKKIEEDGIFYLASLRLIPVFPFFVVNLVMGLTAIRAFTFFWVSLMGMLPGTAAYVYAGREFSKIHSMKDILSGNVLFAFFLLGTLPILFKLGLQWFRNKKLYKNFHRPKSFDFDVVAIGAGAAGLVTSFIVAKAGARVALIERERMGGDCLNTGCVPSKALIKSAKVIHSQKRAKDFGLDSIEIGFNFSKIMERVQRVIQEIEPHDSVERFEGLGVDCIKGSARILDPWTIGVGDKKITTRNIVIATGARPRIPEISGISQIPYVTSENIWALRELPRRLMILGGGPIGMEMAQAFGRLGSEVIIIENGDRIMSKEDPEVSYLMEGVLRDEGIQIYTNHAVLSFEKKDGNYQVVCEHKDKKIELRFDLLLVAVGRTPNTESLNLKHLGIKTRDNGTISANDYLQTTLPNIFVCGDVTGPYQLTHMASHQASTCAINALSPKMFPIDYSAVPWCTYTDPEVATVGETSESARQKGIDFNLTEYEVSDLDRAITEGEKRGVVRVLTKPGSDEILGATIVHSQASSSIVEFVAAIKNKSGLNSILRTIHVYPSFGEANREVASRWKLNRINTTALKYLAKYFTWKRGK